MKPFAINSLATDKSYDKYEHRNGNSHPDPSFGKYQTLSQSPCSLCASKHLILKQLQTLEQVILEKNRKIEQLEEFIHRLSQMVLIESTDSELSHNVGLFKNQEKTLSSARKMEQNQSELTNPSQISFLKEKSAMSDSLPSSSRLSRINSQLTAFEAEEMKFEVKRSIQNMNLENKPSERETACLKKKLADIINILPDLKGSGMHEFQSLSEPFNEGTAGSINEKTNLRVSKTPRFQKKVKSEYSSVGESEGN